MTIDDGDRYSADGDSALRVLRSAQQEIEALRGGGLDPATERGLILRVANVVDRSLRRLLRDQEDVDLDLRLRALAPDEIRGDEVLAELRRAERLPVELAAGIHELFATRRRLEDGTPPDDADRVRAVSVADHLAQEIGKPRRWPPLSTPLEEPLIRPPAAAATRRRARVGLPLPVWGVGAGIVVLAAVIGFWTVARGGDDSGMLQGVALFEQGAFADAAQHFWRYAEANPDDPTPQLYLARIHRRMERPELAADAIRLAQEIAPNDPAVHRELGFLLLDIGQPDVAVGRFHQAIELDEASTEGWVGLVRALRESGREEDVPRAIAEAPAEARALLTQSDSI